MKVLSVFLAGGIAASPAIFDDSKLAKSILKRQRRNNNGLFEEARAADIVRECHEEICSFDEVLEYYEDEDQANQFWNEATKKCSKPNACHRPGTATCVNMWRKRRCECREGYTITEEADDCSKDIDECATENFCANDGVCTNHIGGFNCDCKDGWGGARCDEDIDECLADTPVCQNGGTCSNNEGSYTCSCPDNWTGANCEIDVDECANAAANGEELCSNSGKCMNTQGDFQCLCTMGWAGKTCLEDFDECAAGLCPAGTICVSDKQTFSCTCPERGCNNLDEAVYQEQLRSTYGFEDNSVSEFSGDEGLEEVIEEVIEEVEEEVVGDDEFVGDDNDDVEDVLDEEGFQGTDGNEVVGDDYYGDSEVDDIEENNAATDEMLVEDNDAGDVWVNIDDDNGEEDQASDYENATESTGYEY